MDLSVSLGLHMTGTNVIPSSTLKYLEQDESYTMAEARQPPKERSISGWTEAGKGRNALGRPYALSLEHYKIGIGQRSGSGVPQRQRWLKNRNFPVLLFPSFGEVLQWPSY